VAARSMLWADLRIGPSPPDLCGSLPKSYGAQRVTTVADIFCAIQEWVPWAVCFEYDSPDASRLDALTETRRRHQSLPVVIVTEEHSEDLAAWAYRCCVWDYLVKPLPVRRLCDSLAASYRAAALWGNVDSAGGPNATRVPAGSRVDRSQPLAQARSYVESNYAEKIQLATVARICNLSPFQFSRNFKKENGISFRDFVVRLRIQRAAQLMRERRASVTEAAFVVGFNDLSYFARMFRRQLGVTPSHYRTEREPVQLSLFSKAA
jgi:AraC-like DNA-binding protein